MREKILYITINIFFVLLGISLFWAQVIRYPHYSRLSKNNAIRIMSIDGPRGNIFDRNGTLVVSSRLSFDVAVIYHDIDIREFDSLTNLLSNVLGTSKSEMARLLVKASRRPYEPVTLMEDIGKEKALVLEEMSVDIDGLIIQTRSRRHYLYDNVGSHIFGYLTEINEDELEGLEEYGYQMRDLVGRSGLEKYYEMYLRGIDGGTQVLVDSKGRQVKTLGLKEPSSGKDLYLTIDIRLEELCDKLLADKKGVCIVMNPKNGEILALVSHPSYDPNVFVKAGASRDRLRLLNDKTGRPLSDRAISGLYPPGSVFKVVTASAGLETKRINRNTRFSCVGSYNLGRAKFDCWKEGGHGSQNIVEGLMNSCNVFFYNVGRLTGVDSLEAFSKLFGFGRPTGIDLPDEVSGIVPGRMWKRIHKNEAWYEGETVNYAIGQGYLVVTPIQVLTMMASISNSGEMVRPHFVKQIDSKLVSEPKPKKIGIKNSTLRLIDEGLNSCVNNEVGTGKRAKVEGVSIAGKTGTAQNPQGETHAWFAGFAPYNSPSICLVVFLEHGGKGGLSPAEMAHDIFADLKTKGYL